MPGPYLVTNWPVVARRDEATARVRESGRLDFRAGCFFCRFVAVILGEKVEFFSEGWRFGGYGRWMALDLVGKGVKSRVSDGFNAVIG